MTTSHSSKHLAILKDTRDMPILQPTLITSPSSNRNLSVNNQKIAHVGECHTPQNTSVRGKQSPLSPKAADRPETDNNLTIYTQNIHGLRANKEKLEYLIRKMEENCIDAFMIQEIDQEMNMLTTDLNNTTQTCKELKDKQKENGKTSPPSNVKEITSLMIQKQHDGRLSFK